MFIDYVTLMLINMGAGLFLLACYVYKGIDNREHKKWVSGFAITGLIAFISGFHMIWNWPLPGSYNIAYGEMSILLGALFLGASLSFANGWDLFSLGIYAFFAGLAAVIIGIRMVNLSLTNEPLISGLGFILSGLSGILVLPVIYFRNNRPLRFLVTIFLIVATFIWLRTGYMSYWAHLSGMSKWTPPTMQTNK